VDPLPAKMVGLDLGAAGEPVGENGGSWVRAPDRRPQPVLGTGNRHVVVPTLEAASSARTGSQPNADPGLAFGPGLHR